MISRSKIRLFVGSILALALLAIFQSGVVFAGLINVNLTDTTTTGIGNDGSGPLGSGAWNRVNDAQAAFTNQLITSANLATGITMTQSPAPTGADFDVREDRGCAHFRLVGTFACGNQGMGTFTATFDSGCEPCADQTRSVTLLR